MRFNQTIFVMFCRSQGTLFLTWMAPLVCIILTLTFIPQKKKEKKASGNCHLHFYKFKHMPKLSFLAYEELTSGADYGLSTIGTCLGPPPAGGPHLTKKMKIL